MATERMWNFSPGTLAPNSRLMPSSGWIRRISVFGRRSAAGAVVEEQEGRPGGT